MSTQKPLRLPSRLELSHPSLPHPGRFMGLLCPIVRISRISHISRISRIVMNNNQSPLLAEALHERTVRNHYKIITVLLVACPYVCPSLRAMSRFWASIGAKRSVFS
jgi:hypothetical protein